MTDLFRHAQRLTVLLIIATAGCHPAPTPLPLPDPEAVNGELALGEVRRFVATGPRVSGTHGASRAAAYLRERLQGQGYRALLDAFSDPTPDGNIAFVNVIGIPPGCPGSTLTEVLTALDEPAVLLLSHYDTKSGISDRFTGANDSGSSSGLLLHLAGLLAADGRTSPPVILAFVDGEECRREYGPHDGLHGSRHLARQIVDAKLHNKVRAVIVLDMIGDADLTIRIPANTTRALLRLALRAAKAENARSRFGISRGTIIDDHVPFLDHKIPAIDLIDFEYGSAPGLNDYWHTDADTVDKLSAQSLQTVGRVVLRMLEQLRP